MSVPKDLKINSCESWMKFIDPLRDLLYQREHWFNEDKCTISSFEESVSLYVEHYDKIKKIIKFDEYYNQEVCDLLKLLYDQLKAYEPDYDRMLQMPTEDALLKDPKWLEVVNRAQKIYEAFGSYLREVKNAKG